MIKGIIYYDYTTNKMTKEDHLAKIFANALTVEPSNP